MSDALGNIVHDPADFPWPCRRLVSVGPDDSPRPAPRTFTDAELTEIYNKANDLPDGKRPPITTQRIFAAMRAMLEQL